MPRPRLIKNKEKRNRLLHIISGFIILIHAYSHYEDNHESYMYFAIAGTIFLIIALLHPIIEKKAPWIDGVFFVIEGILSLIVAYDFYHMGKKGLPVVYLLLGIFQIFIALKKGRKGIEHHNMKHTIEHAPVDVTTTSMN